MEKPKLLIVEDDQSILKQMKWALQGDYNVFLAGDRRTALETFRKERPPVATLDLGLPPDPAGAEEGLQTLQDILVLDPLARVIVITGNAQRENALVAVQQGAHDYYAKPVVVDELRLMLSRAVHLYSLEEESLRQLQKEIQPGDFSDILSASREMQQVLATVRKVAPAQVSVLITGESGTGKELVARAIHDHSPRREKPFVAINCGAIPETLLESELFGHEKGTFTGAHAQRKGKLEYADRGTLFLDEIGELPLSLQVKLLRFLQEGTIERLGGRQAIALDIRVIAATNKDPNQAVEEGSFRQDLYHRLAVVRITLPPLPERREDILLLARAFLKRHCREHRKKLQGFTPAALTALQTHAWPGNVRELENRIQRAVLLAEGPLVCPKDLELEAAGEVASVPSLREAREQLERSLVMQALARNNGNITHSAVQLGISRQGLNDLLNKHGLRPEPAR